MLLLLVVLGCSPEGRAFHECVERMEVGCECSASFLTGAAWSDCGPSAQEQFVRSCAYLDESRCDPDSETFDAVNCESDVEPSLVEYYDEGRREEERCAVRAVKNHCEELQAAEGTAEELEQEILESCGWTD